MRYKSFNNGSKSKPSYTTPDASAWLASFEQNKAAQNQAFSAPYNSGIYKGDATSIYNAPAVYSYMDNGASIEHNTWLDKAKSFIDGLNSSVLAFTVGMATGNLGAKNTARAFTQKLLETSANDNLAQIDDYEQSLEDIKLVENYSELQNDKSKFETLMKNHIKSGGSTSDVEYQTLKVQYDEADKQIKNLDNYFTGEGRNHQVVRKLMYNLDNVSASDKIKANASYIFQNLGGSGKWYDGPIQLLNLGKNILNYGANYIGKLGNATGLTNNSYYDTAITEQAIMNSDSFLNLYKKNQKQYDVKKAQEWKKYLKDMIAEKTVEYEQDKYAARTGNVTLNQMANAIPVISMLYDGSVSESLNIKRDALKNKDNWANKTIKLYNPEDIPESFKQGVDKFGENWYDLIIHPQYAAVQTASSVAMMKHTLNAQGVDALLMFAAKKLPVIGWAATAASAANSIDAAVKQRRQETGQEKIEGLGTRVFSELAATDERNISHVISEIQDYAKRNNLDTTDMTPQELMEMGVAFNVQTDNPAFEQIKKDARKGINKLVNANNALALMDYAQQMPFYSFGGKALNKFAKAAINSNANRAVAKFLSPSLRATSSKLSQPIMDELITVKDYLPTFNGIFNSATDKIANRFIKKEAASAQQFANNMNKGLYAKSLGNYLKSKSKLLLAEGISEGIEEGQQQILQDRYARGLYDDYNRSENILDVDEVFGNIGLAGESMLAYFGLKPFDKNLNTDEIRKAMNIGFASSIMQSGVQHSAKNALPAKFRGGDNFRDFIQQVKSDKTVTSLIGKHFEDLDDQAHLELFYDAFRKGVTDKQLITSMSRLKNNLDESNPFIKKSNMDAEMQLMQNAYNLYNNKEIRKTLNDAGIKTFSDKYKNFVVTGAKRITDYQMSNDAANENAIEVDKLNHERADIVDMLFEGTLSDDEINKIQEENPKLAKTIKKLSDEYESTKESVDKKRKEDLSSFAKEMNNFDAFKNNRHIREYVSQNYASGKIGKAAFDEDLASVFGNSKSKNLAIEYAFRQAHKEQFNETAKTFDDAIKNKFIVKALRSKLKTDTTYSSLLDRFKNDIEFSDEIRNIAEDYAFNNDVSKAEFIKERIAVLNSRRQLENIKKILSSSESRLEFLNLYQRETGLDIDTDKLGTLISELKRLQKNLTDEQDRILGNKKGKTNHTYEDLFKDDINEYEIDNDDSYDKAVTRYFINKASLKSQKILAQMYSLVGNKDVSINPISLNEAINGTKRTDVFEEELTQFEKMNAKLNSKNELESEHVDVKSTRRDMSDVSKKAQLKQLLKDLEDQEHRYRIANRLWKEAPVTEVDLNDAADGDIEAAEKVDSQTEKIINEANREQSDDLEDSERINGDLAIPDTLQQEDELAERYMSRNKARDEKKRKQKEKALSDKKGSDGVKDTDNIEDEADVESEDNSINQLDALTRGMIADDSDIEEEGDGETVPSEDAQAKNQPENTPAEPTSTQDEDDIDSIVDDGDKTESELESEIETQEEDYSEEELPEGDSESQEAAAESEIDVDDDDIQESASEIEAEVASEEQDVQEAAAEAEINSFEDVEDISDVDTEDYGTTGRVKYKDKVLSKKQSKQLMDELIILGRAEIDGFDQKELPDGTVQDVERYRMNVTDETIGSFVSNTFFYQPNPDLFEETGEYELMKLTVNGEQVKLNKPLASGKHLSEKLSQEGWLQSTKKYYIVTQSQQSEKNTIGDVRDSMTVCLILEDGNNTYATTLRALGLMVSDVPGEPNSKYTVSQKKNLIDRLITKGVDFSKILKPGQRLPNSYSRRAKLATNAINEMEMKLAKSWWVSQGRNENDFEKWWLHKPLKKDYHKSEHETEYKQDLTTWRNVHTQFKILARKHYQKPGRKMLTEEAIKDQINGLRELRNSIIDKYLEKRVSVKDGKEVVEYIFPEQVRDDVTPSYVQQSNGVIDNVKQKRIVGDNEHATIDQIQAQLNDGSILLGYGKGALAETSEQFAIYGLLSKDSGKIYDGKGLSGKLYWLVKGLSGTDTLVPIMLHEERFDTQEFIDKDGNRKSKFIGSKDDVKLTLSYDATQGKLINTGDGKVIPSTAEILMYMLCGRFDFGTNNRSEIDKIVEFFIHSGEKTLLRNQPKTGGDPMNFLARKQLFFGDIDGSGINKLHIGIGDPLNGYQEKIYTEDEIFDDSEQGENNRKEIVHAIATQMHWNTDIDFINSSIKVGDSTSVIGRFIQNMISEYFSGKGLTPEQQLEKTIDILGNKQLSFRVKDFFELKNGKFVPKSNVSVLAWLLSNKKVSTDVSKKIFKDPFVFAGGVNSETPAPSDGKPQSTSKIKLVGGNKQGVISTGFSVINPDLFNKANEVAGDKVAELRKNMGFKSPKTQEEREAYRKQLEENHRSANNNGGLQDVIYVTDPYLNTEFKKFNVSNLDKLVDHLNTLVKDFLDKYNKEYGTSYKIEDIGGITKNTALTTINSIRINNGYLRLDLFKNGKGKLQFVTSTMKTWSQPVTGVYSKNKSKGKFDKDKAVKWLEKHLGINRYNIIVRNGVMRSTDNEQVFGVTQVSLDRIAGELTGLIQLSTNGGEGVTYHEAWHYVNLLLNDANTRSKIWDSYAKTHKEFNKEGVTNLMIEEALADEFMNYIVMQQDNSLSGMVKKLFNNVLDFVVTSRRKSAYRALFRSIKRGEFGNTEHLDRQSAKEFAEKYKYGVNKIDYSVPGFSDKDLNNLKYIDNHTDLFAVLDAVIRKVISDFNIDSIEKIKQISGAYDKNQQLDFSMLLDKVQDMADEAESEQMSSMLQDIHDNPEFLKRKLVETFADFGINVKIKHEKDVEEAEDAEERNDFEFDKFDLSISKKDNAALRVKMFMYSIPKYTRVFNEDGSVDIQKVQDGFGSSLFWDFNEAWTKILKDLWQASSLDDVYTEDVIKDGIVKYKKGEYKYNSIYGMVSRRAESDVFYYALKEKLDQLLSNDNPDVQLRSQLFATINSSKPNVSYIKISDPKDWNNSDDDFVDDSEIDSSLYQFSLISDKLREWRINDDSLVSTERNIARQWSKNLFTNGLTKIDGDKGIVVSDSFVSSRQRELDKVVRKLSKLLVKKNNKYISSESTVLSKLNNTGEESAIKNDVVKFLNSIGIDADRQSIDIYISMNSDSENISGYEQAKILHRLLSSTDKTKGGISGIINETLSSSVGENIIQADSVNGFEKQLDQVYNNYNKDSFIAQLAASWDTVHPDPSDFSVKGPSGEMYYPIGQNNYISSRVRNLNDPQSETSKNLRRDPYSRHSLLLDASDNVNEDDSKTQLKINAFVGLKDGDRLKGSDYFGITAMEDYLSKMYMTENDHLILPTMADKKTWYSITSPNLKLRHDVVISEIPNKLIRDAAVKVYSENFKTIKKFKSDNSIVEIPINDVKDYEFRSYTMDWYRSLPDDNEFKQDIKNRAISQLYSGYNFNGFSVGKYGDIIPAYSKDTLNTIAGYFIDELDALIQYYSEDNIKYLTENPNKLQENFHGVIKNGRMDFSGNGGKFRYFYDILPHHIDGYDVEGDINLNQTLQAIFEAQKMFETPGFKVTQDDNSVVNGYSVSQLRALRSDESELDGFELVRDYLKKLREYAVEEENLGINTYSKDILNSVNNFIYRGVIDELELLSENGPLQMVQKDKNGRFIPTNIPQQFFNPYVESLSKTKLFSSTDLYDNYDIQNSALISLISNHFINSVISTIEFEKVFSGDPAQYKSKGNKKYPSVSTTISIYGENGDVEVEVNVDNLDDIHSDKIKRLGSTLSPGEEIRTQYNEDEIKKLNIPSHSKYTTLDVEDIETPSLFYDEVKQKFLTQLVVDYVRNGIINEQFNNFISHVSDVLYNKAKDKSNGENVKPKRVSKSQAIDLLYSDRDYFNILYNSVPEDIKNKIESQLDQQMNPYKKINVCDAQVIIRPDLYRRVRIGLGQWSVIPDETGYSDEDAFNIIENGYYTDESGNRVNVGEQDWAKDERLASKIQKLQLFPLKMSYFDNYSHQEGDNFRNRTILNKMAIFPLFKFNMSTNTGSKLYLRMNRAGNEIDMITFKSAVKVGAVQKGLQLISDDSNVEDSVSKLSSLIDRNSDTSVDYKTGIVTNKDSEDSLSIKVQSLDNLRMQLNTKAHETDERMVGKQMFKLAFSNLVDDEKYGHGDKRRTGRAIRKDIMTTINLLTQFGVISVKDEFFNEDGDVDNSAVSDFVQRVCKSNGLGTSALQILGKGGTISSLMSRRVFENSVSKFINKLVVDINSKGGTAIQQSVLGFSKFKKGDNLLGLEQAKDRIPETIELNNGNELKWKTDKNYTQVILSENFFRDVVPSNVQQNGYEAIRAWLFEKNIIGENAKPLGVGYRIPTQGQSSMFAPQVADILPKQSGDVIIVPREFTGQTGSDFDVDKIFLALKYFNKLGSEHNIDYDLIESIYNGDADNTQVAVKIISKISGRSEDDVAKAIESQDDELINSIADDLDIEKAVKNHLIDTYIDILTDDKNFSLARGSIDVVTNILQEQLIKKHLKNTSDGYSAGGYQLSPYFQTMRKLEFSSGKQGIGPFALNVTNLSLTQYTGLTFDYGKNPYEFGSLDAIYGEDGMRIADWLSAMVNANVDVAKDPYVFALNVNQTTYSHTNFLIRAGKGLGVFTFLTQPSIKEFANIKNNSGNVYGFNLEGDKSEGDYTGKYEKSIYNQIYYSLLKQLKECLIAVDDEDSQKQIKGFINYVDSLIIDKNHSSITPEERNSIKRPFSKKQMFDVKLGKTSLEFSTQAPGINKALSLAFQACALSSFKDVGVYAKKLSDLVKVSQIDTKRFGNSIAQHINFSNRIDIFKTTDGFTINRKDFKSWVEKLAKEREDKTGQKVSLKRFESTVAINEYFKNTFLGSKFKEAKKLTRLLLKNQSFTATRLFDNIFRNIMGQTLGFKDTDNNTVSYKPTSKDEVINTISDSIDNVLRFLSLFGVGSRIIKSASFKERYPDAIDFTMGGDINSVKNKIKTILFGNKDIDNIFLRFNKLKNNMQVNPQNYPGLIDPVTLGVQNELLNYLNPISANEKSPVGRFVLSTNQMKVNQSKKQVLSSAFSQLLSYQDEEVRQLAEDLAFYAYYSSYDQNRVDAFFDLVPVEYRAQYDRALAFALHDMNRSESRLVNTNNDLLSLYNYDVDNIEADRAENIIDIISRNYWYDDSIVKTHYIKEGDSVLLSGSNYDVLGEPIMAENENNKVYPSFIVSGNSDSSYIKIKSGKNYMLYKNIGAIIKFRDGNSVGMQYVYAAANKAGIRQGQANILEMYGSFGVGSIFESNKLDEQFSHDKVVSDVEKLVKDSNEANDAYKFELSWYKPVIKQATSADEDNFIQPKNINTERVIKVGPVKLKAGQKAPDRVGINKADVVINIVNDSVEESDYYNTIKSEEAKEKTVTVNIKQDPSKFIDKVLSLINKDDAVIHFTTPMFDYVLERGVSDDRVSEYIESEMKRLENIFNTQDVKEKEVLLKQNREMLESFKARRVLALQDLHSFVREILNQLSINDVNINRISTSSTKKGNSKRYALAKSVAVLSNYMQDTFSGKNIIYCNNNLTSDNKAFKNYIAELQYEVDDNGVLLEDESINEQIDINETLAKDVLDYDNKSLKPVESVLKETHNNQTKDDVNNNELESNPLSMLTQAIDYSSDDFLDEVQEDMENNPEDNNHEKC